MTNFTVTFVADSWWIGGMNARQMGTQNIGFNPRNPNSNDLKLFGHLADLRRLNDFT
jgi:hypothetical protein